MIVYVITEGEYSDYHIEAVTLDPERAKRLAIIYNGRVEQYDTEKPTEEKIREYKPYVFVTWKNGTIRARAPKYSNDKYRDDHVGGERWRWGDEEYWTYVQTDDVDRAIKIAADRFAKRRAEDAGL